MKVSVRSGQVLGALALKAPLATIRARASRTADDARAEPSDNRRNGAPSPFSASICSLRASSGTLT